MPEPSQPLSKYILLKRLPRDAFTAKFPHPFLLETPSIDSSTDDETAFATLKVSAAELKSLPGGGTTAKENALVHTVAKKSSGTFEGMVTVGRSANNDIILPSNAASKFHAYFTCTSSEQSYQLTDAKSTNGTFVNGKRLEPQKKEPLFERDTITFASQFRYQFFTARGFHDYLTENF